MSEEKSACYICKGCGIGERLDAGQMSNIAKREGRMQIVKEHDFLCNAEGVKMIQDDIDNENVNKICIAACSRRAKTEAFSFEGVMMNRTNLREGVIWVRADDEESKETTQEMADDYIRMGCADLKYMNMESGSGQQMRNDHILVVGGGVGGMTAAIEAAQAGYKATIVEKSGELGGWAAKLKSRTPSIAPYADPADTEIEAMKAAIDAFADVTVHLNATVAKTSGAPGRFSADIATESGSIVTENFGAIIQATGFDAYDASKLEQYSYGKNADIVDQAGLEALALAAGDGEIKRPSNGDAVKRVVFVQCAGQRSDKDGELSYCSGHCCSTSIKQAMYFKDQNPDIDTQIIYTDLRTPGSAGEDFYRSGQNKGVTFTKGIVSEVTADLKVKLKDLILDEEIEEQADLVVLATGQVPNSGINIDAIASDDDEEGSETETEESSNEIAGVSVLNLDYRQGPDMPQLRDGYADSHFICFPYETRRTGIYATGTVRRPMDIQQTKDDAAGAALKAIQALENAALGRAAHPRSGDLSFPQFRKEGCTQCKRCTVECPFGAINEDEERYPEFNESRCRRCGTCMGACPVRVISFENYSLNTLGAQIKAVDIPDEFEEKPRILVLACENDAYPALDQAGMNKITYNPFVRVIPVRCLGSINSSLVIDAVTSGYDGVMLMGCPKGENYQCHFVRGSEMAHERMGKIEDTLQGQGLEPERVQTDEVSIADIQRIPQLFNEMGELIDKVGMSPFKF